MVACDTPSTIQSSSWTENWVGSKGALRDEAAAHARLFTVAAAAAPAVQATHELAVAAERGRPRERRAVHERAALVVERHAAGRAPEPRIAVRCRLPPLELEAEAEADKGGGGVTCLPDWCTPTLVCSSSTTLGRHSHEERKALQCLAYQSTAGASSAIRRAPGLPTVRQDACVDLT